MTMDKLGIDAEKVFKILIIIVLLLLALVFVYKAGKKIVSNAKEANFDKNIDKKVNGVNVNLLAQSYKQAMNPSGSSWLSATDGTDEDSIFDLAIKTKGVLSEVNKAYKAKFGTALVDDLRDELDTEDFQKWQAIAT